MRQAAGRLAGRVADTGQPVENAGEANTIASPFPTATVGPHYVARILPARGTKAPHRTPVICFGRRGKNRCQTGQDTRRRPSRLSRASGCRRWPVVGDPWAVTLAAEWLARPERKKYLTVCSHPLD